MIDRNVWKGMPYDERLGILMSKPEDMGLPEEAEYVAQYMQQYCPATDDEIHEENESSLDIQETLMSVCLIDTKVISRVMTLLGYRLVFAGISQPTWGMLPREKMGG